jgi:hypothetical protein
MSIPAADAALTVEGFAEKHVLMAFSRAILPAHATKGGREARAAQVRPAGEIPIEAPPAWMLPTIFWRVPFGNRE